MNGAKKTKRERREELQQKQGDKIVKWIFVCLILLAIIYMNYTFTMVA